MGLLLDKTDVETLLSFRDAYESLRRFFLLEDQGLAVNTERVRTASHGTVLTYQAAASQRGSSGSRPPYRVRSWEPSSTARASQALREAGDLILAKRLGMLDENKLIPFSAVVAGKWARTDNDELALFKSVGVGLLDLATLALLHDKAEKLGVGKEVSLSPKWSPRSNGTHGPLTP